MGLISMGNGTHFSFLITYFSFLHMPDSMLSISATPTTSPARISAEADQASNTAPPAPPATAPPAPPTSPARSRSPAGDGRRRRDRRQRRGKSLTLTILMRNCVLI